MNDIIYSFAPYLASAITAIVGFFFGRKKQNNDFLQEMQGSIDLLVQRNSTLYEEVMGLRKERIELLENQAKLLTEIEGLRGDNETLRREIDAFCQYLQANNLPVPDKPKRRRNEKSNSNNSAVGALDLAPNELQNNTSTSRGTRGREGEAGADYDTGR